MDDSPGQRPSRIGSRVQRRYVIRTAVDARYGEEALVALVHDLSASGVKIELRATRLMPGDWLHLALPLEGERAAQVAWADGMVAGCQFGEPLAEDIAQAIAAECRRINEAAQAERAFRLPD